MADFFVLRKSGHEHGGAGFVTNPASPVLRRGATEGESRQNKSCPNKPSLVSKNFQQKIILRSPGSTEGESIP